MRPVFCGNFDFDARQSDLERLFSKYGPIRRIDMKSGYAFIYFEDERDAEDAIKRLDQADFGHSRRRLSVEWSRQEEPVPKNRDRPTGDAKPTRTLFVINFDPLRTKIRDIEKHFEPYGKISNIRIRKNFAFVRYETIEEASAAVKKTDKSTILDRVVTVEYAFRDDDNERDDRYGAPKQSDDRYGSPKRGDDRYGAPKRGDDRYGSPKRGDDRYGAPKRGDDRYGSPRRGDDRYGAPKRGDDRYGSPRRGDDRYGSPRIADQGRRRGSPYMRPPSPRYQRDHSPDYDRRPRNPGYDRRDGAPYGRSRSPVYARYDRGRSPGYGRY